MEIRIEREEAKKRQTVIFDCSVSVSAYSKWEECNTRFLQFVQNQLFFSEKQKQKQAYLLEENKKQKEKEILGLKSLEILAYERLPSMEAKRWALETMPMLALKSFEHRRQEKALKSFLKAWALYRKAENNPDLRILISRKRKGENWKSKTQINPSLMEMKDLVQVYFEVQDEDRKIVYESERQPAILGALYCFWLLNPLVVVFLLSLFLLFDLAIPCSKVVFSSRFRNLKENIKSKSKEE